METKNNEEIIEETVNAEKGEKAKSEKPEKA